MYVCGVCGKAIREYAGEVEFYWYNRLTNDFFKVKKLSCAECVAIKDRRLDEIMALELRLLSWEKRNGKLSGLGFAGWLRMYKKEHPLYVRDEQTQKALSSKQDGTQED
jgi:hypothetical protein